MAQELRFHLPPPTLDGGLFLSYTPPLGKRKFFESLLNRVKPQGYSWIGYGEFEKQKGEGSAHL
jgi:hypothetical protein